MDSSIPTIPTHVKIMKLKKSFERMCHSNPQTKIIFENPPFQTIFFTGESPQIKKYQDNHLFKNTLHSFDNSTERLKRPSFSRQKTQNQQYQPLSRKRDIKRLSNISYQCQKSQRSQKIQKALEDLKQIEQISINSIQSQQQKIIRFYKEEQTEVSTQLFKRWKTNEKQKHFKLRSPTKNRCSLGKRAKNSPKKASPGIRIRKTLYKIQKTQECIQNLSTIQSIGKPLSPPRLIVRKSSITPWQTSEQALQ